MLSENDDITTTTGPGYGPLNMSIQDGGQMLSGGFLVNPCDF